MTYSLIDTVDELRRQIATLTVQRDAAEKELAYKDEVIDLAHDRAIAAEKVCEAAEYLNDMIYPESVFDGSSGDPGSLAVVGLREALTEWRRTKEGS